MNKQIKILLAVLLSSLSVAIKAQDTGILDVVTLKDGNGVLKGIISELAPGTSITIIPSEALLKIEQKQIAEIMKKSIINVNDTSEIDILTLFNGTQLEGTITERAPGQWTVIRTGKTSPLTYPYTQISKTGKETVTPDIDIFKASGTIDILTLKNSSVVRGIIIEQEIGIAGGSVKIKTKDSGTFIYPLSEIKTVGREGNDTNINIFLQSAFIDVVQLKSGETFKGIIIKQTPGEDVEIETENDDTTSNNKFAYTNVAKLLKEINPKREFETPAIASTPVTEPEHIGDCLWLKDENTSIPLEKQTYMLGTRTPTLWLLDGNPVSDIQLPLYTDIKLLVRTNTNESPATEQVHIFKTELNRGVQKRSIDSTKYPFLTWSTQANENTPTLDYQYTKVGKQSFELTFRLNDPGEYAIYVTGSDKIISLFGTFE